LAKSTTANTANAKGSGTKKVASGIETRAEPKPVRPWMKPARKAIGASAERRFGAFENHLGECARQHLRDVNGLARRSVGDLMAAAGTVGDEQRILGRERTLEGARARPSSSRRVVPGLVAEISRHSAARRFDRLDFQLRNERQRPLDRGHGAEGLLVAMAVQERALLGERLELERETAGFVLAREELLEEQRAFGERVGLATRSIALNSSRRVRRQEGSRPTTSTPRPT